MFALVLLSILMTWAIRRAKFGLGLVAIRDDEDKAAGIGVVTPVYKSLAFMASAVLVGVAGAIYGYYVSYLSVSTMFDIVLSMQVVLAVLLGGRGTVWGPVLGAFIVVPLAEFTNTSMGGLQAGAFRLIMFGGLLVLVTLVLPRGILPTVREWSARRAAGPISRTGARLDDTPVPDVPSSLRTTSADSAENDDVLRVENVTLRFGGIQALVGATVSVRRGSITALIGPNGSGKTSLFNVVDGTYRPTSGDVLLQGRSVSGLDRTGRAFAGIGRTYQLPRLFSSLSVLENVAVVNPGFSVRALARSAVSGDEADRATELLRFVGLGDYVSARATELSYGQKKLVELAQVLMLDPAVVLLDEPAAGINPTLLRRLGDADPGAQRRRADLRDRRARHAVRAVPRRRRHGADQRPGAAIGRPRADQPRRGGPRGLPGRGLRPRTDPGRSTRMIEFRDVRAGYGGGDVLQGLDLTVETGSITCIVGPNGAGKSTVLRALSGLLRPRARARSSSTGSRCTAGRRRRCWPPGWPRSRSKAGCSAT